MTRACRWFSAIGLLLVSTAATAAPPKKAPKAPAEEAAAPAAPAPAAPAEAPTASPATESAKPVDDLGERPTPAVRAIVESAYGQAVADVFLIAAPLAIITIVAVCLIPNNKLGTKTTIERLSEEGPSAGLVEHATIPNVSWSPDGLIEPKGAIEAKNPLHKSWM